MGSEQCQDERGSLGHGNEVFNAVPRYHLVAETGCPALVGTKDVPDSPLEWGCVADVDSALWRPYKIIPPCNQN